MIFRKLLLSMMNNSRVKLQLVAFLNARKIKIKLDL